MKRILISMFALVIVFSANATNFGFGVKSPSKINSKNKTTQNYTVEEGNFIFSVGFGAPNFQKMTYNFNSDYLFWEGKFFGPFHIKGEYMISDRFGIGLSTNHVSSYAKYTATDGIDTISTSYDYRSTAFNIRVNWHFFNEKDFDMYAGGGIGYKVGYRELKSNDPLLDLDISSKVLPIGMEATIGARYFIADIVGIYVEFGLAKSLIQAGLTVKI